MHIENQSDPLTGQADAGVVDNGVSPMDPPDAYAPPGLDSVAPEDMHPFLRQLGEEHAALAAALAVVEAAIKSVRETGFNTELQVTLLGFCQLIECDFIPHSRQEEAVLFPLLHQRLLAEGEHSPGRDPTTSVDLMNADHLRVIQLAAVIENFLKIAPYLPDDASALVVQDAALRHAKSLTELLRLHMYREDNIVFASAHRLLSAADFERVQAGDTECCENCG